MIKSTLFTVQNGFPYEQLKQPLQFPDDPHGISNWVLVFPLVVYSQDGKKKHTFTQDKVSVAPHSDSLSQQKWKYFVITKNDGSRLYCTFQVSYQKGYLSKTGVESEDGADCTQGHNQCFYLPQCLILMSSQPHFKLQVNLLKIYRQLRKQQSSLQHPTSPPTISHYLLLKAQHITEQFSYQSKPEPYQPPIEIVFDHYLSISQHCQQETILLEKATSQPLLHLYPLQPHSLFQFSHFFRLPLSGRTIANVLTAILLEKQIIVTSNSSNLNVMVIESLLQLIRPLRWEQFMLVHNLPAHLLDAASQNFMPFLVGVHKTLIEEVNCNDKFILFVEQDRFSMPTKLPQIGPALQDFTAQFSLSSPPAHSDERIALEGSIEFVCRLLEPIVQSRGRSLSRPNTFYTQFSKTALCSDFLQKLGKGELAELMELLSIADPQERKLQISKELNYLSCDFQNPRILYHEIEWLQYYLAYRVSEIRQNTRDEGIKLPAIVEVKQNCIGQVKARKRVRKLSIVRERSTSQGPSQRRSGISRQKAKKDKTDSKLQAGHLVAVQCNSRWG